MDPQLQHALDAIDAATRGMSVEQFAAHPEGKWSAAEILEHLSIAFGSTARSLEKTLASGEPKITPPTLWQRGAALLVATMGYFPPGRQAPEFTRPKGMDGESALRTIRENLVAMDASITRCEERFGHSRKIATHPVLGPLSVPQWRKFHLVHTRHHMKQIDRLRSRFCLAQPPSPRTGSADP
ncbi:MAG: DinB family protein [Acidobacteria bacterium]|nr:DinB family protein [Acidobacteriota bacterium]